MDRFVLLLGNVRPLSTTSRLKASRVRYEQKRLQSGASNWRTICSRLGDPGLICVVGQLNTAVFDLLVSPEYAEVAPEFLEAVGRTPHSLFVHESVLTGSDAPPRVGQSNKADEDETYMDFLHSSGWFRSPDLDVRSAVSQLFDRFGIRVIPYTTNAEFEVMAEEFVKDNERDLLFRVYVPAGKLYAAEADKLLSLFRDWLSRVGRMGVRQDGYETPSGHMYEFFGDGSPRVHDLSADFSDFAGFLELCVDDPEEAERRLGAQGLDRGASSAMVSRYAREARRLELDLKHERERRVVQIRHDLESEMLEQALSAAEKAEVSILVDSLVPPVTDGLRALSADVRTQGSWPRVIEAQTEFAAHASDSIMRSVDGTAHLGPEPATLLDLIAAHGGPRAAELVSALHEFEDDQAPPTSRLRARQLLKGFVINSRGAVEERITTAINGYLESRLGL